MKKRLARPLKSPWTLALLGGILLSLAWTPGISPALFLGWFLWLRMLQHLSNKGISRRKSYLIILSGMLTWNTLTVWWISGSTIGGMLGAVIAMSLMMSIVLLLVREVWKVKGRNLALLALTLFWIAYEYFFHNSEIAWPWLTLGNGFAQNYQLVQWYEYTGTLGGSLWVLIVAALLFVMLQEWHKQSRKQQTLTLGLTVALIIFPITLSLYLLHKEENAPRQKPVEVVIVQPNIDPWNEKFDGMTALEQVELMQRIGDSLATENTTLIIAPETSLPNSLWEQSLNTSLEINLLREVLLKHPNAHWLTGATTLRLYPTPEQWTHTARPIAHQPGMAYDAFNVALLLDTSQNIQDYIKSKLVVGVEMLPYPQYLKMLNRLSIDLGGTVGGLGTQKEREVFRTNSELLAAPIICYESAFGEFCTEYVRKGAELLVVITNDGWWGDTPGYRQHFSFSRLRCIENRRYMARSANTGISGIITPTGRTTQTLGWWERGGLKGNVYPETRITFYTQHGDYIGRAATGTSALLALYLLVQLIVTRKTLSHQRPSRS